MRNSQVNLLNQTVLGQSNMPSDMATDCISPAIFIGHTVNYSLQAVWTGTPTGTWKLQCSNDPGVSQADFAKAVNWTDISSSLIAITASGDMAMNIVNAGYQWVRLVYAATSSTGTITVAQIVTKGA